MRDLYLELKGQYRPYSGKVKIALSKSKEHSPGDTLELIIDGGSDLSKNEKFSVVKIGNFYKMKYRGMMNTASDTLLGKEEPKTRNMLDLADTLSILKKRESKPGNRMVFISTLTYKWQETLDTFRYISKRFKDRLH